MNPQPIGEEGENNFFVLNKDILKFDLCALKVLRENMYVRIVLEVYSYITFYNQFNFNIEIQTYLLLN